jgi:signal transduction histidine kinase
VQVYLTESDEDITLIVKDTGPGIPPEHLRYLFQPFYRVTENSKGTGLGLSIAKEIVERHGGKITVESVVGSGSQFIVRLPVRVPTETGLT